VLQEESLVSGVSKVELYAAIRRDAHRGMSQRALTQKYNVGQKTVKQALANAWPSPRKPYPKRGSKIDDHAPWIDEVLHNDLTAPRKQRHTVTRLFDRLVKESRA
jgi:transposase